MHALVLHDLTGPEALRLEDLPEPEAPEGTVAIGLHAAGIGFARARRGRLRKGETVLVLGAAGGGARRSAARCAACSGRAASSWSGSPRGRAGVPDVLHALGERRLSGKPVATVP